MKTRILKRHKTFDGETLFCEHDSGSTKTVMKFSCFVPSGGRSVDKALIWLSGLTCTEENFITKAGAQRWLAKTGMMLVCPDTSPRGLNLPGEHDSYDFGSGAGFYVNATTPGYRDHYQLEDYIVKELRELIAADFGVSAFSLSGHSMGGHGALVLGLKHPEFFRSVSAFSPIVSPMNCSWGQKALEGYLGEKSLLWNDYDACELVLTKRTRPDKILIDQGLADEFLEKQLRTDLFKRACDEAGQSVEVRYRDGYDHSYYFIQSFIEDHIRFHLTAY